MKRFYVLLAALGLVFFVSSCKNTMDLTKRRYTKGYHFEKHTAPSSPQEGVAKKEKVQSIELIAQSVPVQKPENRELRGGLQENSGMNAFGKGETKKTVAPVTRKEEKINNTTGFSEKEAVKQGSNVQQKGTSKGGGGDAELILLVILCLFPFINLIAVYIHDGKSVTTNFWITLLLDVLFFLPGIVFALLVVLDVVNLA